MMDIFSISFDGWNKIVFTLNWIAALIIIIMVVAAALIMKKVIPYIGRHSIQIDEATLGVGNSNVTIKFNKKDQEIAYMLWVELSTRKIGIEFDKENDVIEEIYNSWYDFFGIARELLKNIPAERLPYSNDLIELTQKVLNDGLRPHLTKWQARYRKWYHEAEKEKKSPQEVQKLYDEYDLLVKDLKKTNDTMISYKNCMYEIAFKK